MSGPVPLTIDGLASQGEGVAETSGGKVYVPFTLPGEAVTADIEGDHGKLVRIDRPSTDRIAPICRHFGTCGGCALQHAGAPLYSAFKRDQVAHALKSRGFGDDVDVADLVPIAAGTRRRATFGVARKGEDFVLGYHAARSHDLVAIGECPVLRPSIVRELPNLRALLGLALPRLGSGELHVTDTGHGLDVALSGTGLEMAAKRRSALGAWMTASPRVLRLIVDGEQIAARATPTIDFSGHAVTLPPGSFLQAAAEAEAGMVAIAAEALSKLKKQDRIADLFSGLGAFALALAARNAVLAVEWDVAAVASLTAAARQPGLRELDVLRRDLFREPLSVRELEPFAAVLFDPPRAGALGQAEQLAASSVCTVIAVSCNPATFARDARALVDGGYRMGRVTPIDQFLYSPHVEVVAVFTKAKARSQP